MIAPAARVRWFPAGKTAATGALGALVLVQHSSLVARLIRLGQRMRRLGAAAWPNHAAVVVDDTPGAVRIAEATARGVVVSPLDGYAHKLYCVVEPDVTGQERLNTAAYAESTEGWGYGWLNIAGEVVFVLTGLPLVIGWGHSVICSGDAATALIASRLRPDRALSMVMPGHLAQWFGAVPPEGILGR